jgi:hypothetical protein
MVVLLLGPGVCDLLLLSPFITRISGILGCRCIVSVMVLVGRRRALIMAIGAIGDSLLLQRIWYTVGTEVWRKLS